MKVFSLETANSNPNNLHSTGETKTNCWKLSSFSFPNFSYIIGEWRMIYLLSIQLIVLVGHFNQDRYKVLA